MVAEAMGGAIVVVVDEVFVAVVVFEPVDFVPMYYDDIPERGLSGQNHTKVFLFRYEVWFHVEVFVQLVA